MDRILAYFLLVIVGALCAFGDATVYQWAKTNRPMWWFVSCCFWVIAATILGFVFRQNSFSLSLGATLSLVIHVSVVLTVDRVYYSVRLSSFHWGAILCFIIGLAFIEYGRGEDPEKAVSLSGENSE